MSEYDTKRLHSQIEEIEGLSPADCSIIKFVDKSGVKGIGCFVGYEAKKGGLHVRLAGAASRPIDDFKLLRDIENNPLAFTLKVRRSPESGGHVENWSYVDTTDEGDIQVSKVIDGRYCVKTVPQDEIIALLKLSLEA